MITLTSLGGEAAAAHFGVKTRCIITDGSQPVGRGVGPAREAHDVVAVLQYNSEAPQKLRTHLPSGRGGTGTGRRGQTAEGALLAEATLADGRAWAKFQAICKAQGALRTPPTAPLQSPILARRSSRVVHINNRQIATLAKLAGAPERKAAGLTLEARLRDDIGAGQPLLTLHAESEGELAYALEYAAAHPDLMEIQA